MRQRRLFKALPAVLLSFSLLFSGCSASEFQLSMYDAEDQVLEAADSYFYSKSSKKVVNRAYSASFGSFTGADTLWDSLDSLDVPAPGVTVIEGSVNLESGQLKLVLIPEDGDLITFYEAELGEQDFSFETTLPAGRCRVKMVGKEAAGSIEITLPGIPS